MSKPQPGREIPSPKIPPLSTVPYYGIIPAGLTKVGKKATKEGKGKKEKRKKKEKERRREREGGRRRIPHPKAEETPEIIKNTGKRGSTSITIFLLSLATVPLVRAVHFPASSHS